MLIIFLTYSLQKLFAAGSSKALGTVGPSFYLKRCCDHFVTTFYEYNGKTPKESREKSCQKRDEESGKKGSQESGTKATPPLGLAYWLGNTKKDLQPRLWRGFALMFPARLCERLKQQCPELLRGTFSQQERVLHLS